MGGLSLCISFSLVFCSGGSFSVPAVHRSLISTPPRAPHVFWRIWDGSFHSALFCTVFYSAALPLEEFLLGLFRFWVLLSSFWIFTLLRFLLYSPGGTHTAWEFLEFSLEMLPLCTMGLSHNFVHTIDFLSKIYSRSLLSCTSYGILHLSPTAFLPCSFSHVSAVLDSALHISTLGTFSVHTLCTAFSASLIGALPRSWVLGWSLVLPAVCFFLCFSLEPAALVTASLPGGEFFWDAHLLGGGGACLILEVLFSIFLCHIFRSLHLPAGSLHLHSGCILCILEVFYWRFLPAATLPTYTLHSPISFSAWNHWICTKFTCTRFLEFFSFLGGISSCLGPGVQEVPACIFWRFSCCLLHSDLLLWSYIGLTAWRVSLWDLGDGDFLCSLCRFSSPLFRFLHTSRFSFWSFHVCSFSLGVSLLWTLTLSGISHLPLWVPGSGSSSPFSHRFLDFSLRFLSYTLSFCYTSLFSSLDSFHLRLTLPLYTGMPALFAFPGSYLRFLSGFSPATPTILAIYSPHLLFCCILTFCSFPLFLSAYGSIDFLRFLVLSFRS